MAKLNKSLNSNDFYRRTLPANVSVKPPVKEVAQHSGSRGRGYFELGIIVNICICKSFMLSKTYYRGEVLI